MARMSAGADGFPPICMIGPSPVYGVTLQLCFDRWVRLRWTPNVSVILSLALVCLAAAARSSAVQMPPAARFAVPILCTENQLAARTKARGTGVIVDASGIILTAAHVILEAKLDCTLTVLVPNDEWSRASKFYTFSVQQCSADRLLDIAACHIKPLDTLRDWSFVRVARIQTRGWKPGSIATITGFTGWGWFPTMAQGTLLSAQIYRTPEGCYCELAVGAPTHEGMSGSPMVNEDGEVIGLVTLAGTGKFRGLSFGTSTASAAGFLRKYGLGGALVR